MSDELLPYYNRELAYLRRLGAEFAEAHPKIAGRLRLGAETIEDPHVARLIEAVAFLNAHIRRKLDDDFPELTQALLGVLYPHYLAPIPPMAIVQFQPPPDLGGAYTLPRETALETDPIHGEPCRFRTVYPVTLWPIAVEAASLRGRPLSAPRLAGAESAQACLRLSLRSTLPELPLARLAPGALRFFLRGQAQHVYALYELLCNHLLQVAVAKGADDPEPIALGADCLRPVGLALDEGLLPYPARAFPGYRLLSEWFACPDKFLFCELAGLDGQALARAGERAELYLYLARALPELERAVDAQTFALGCTPVVNLSRRRAEPIHLDHARSEYRVVPDARRPQAFEVYAVERVTAHDGDGRPREVLPLFGLQHGQQGRAFWLASRRPAGARNPGTEVFLSLVDLDFEPLRDGEGYLSVETTCLNRDLPGRLPFGGGQPRLQLAEGNAPLRAIACLTPPTPTLRPPLGQGLLWRLISHLALNHLSLTEAADGTLALREILRLYDFRDSAETRATIDGIVSLGCRPVHGRAPHGGVCRGTEVRLELDEAQFAGSGAFLFAAVLERFLGLYCSLNSFTRLELRYKGREGVVRRWPARSGELRLL
ncbi:MAG TPA: type VI secretion system baseplate subunit TssF [Candidatus Competibacteraceae bacterium]|nr:type VI secretion system baseplate subunit TssF [Candidatus Competibacteraceae bacterium]